MKDPVRILTGRTHGRLELASVEIHYHRDHRLVSLILRKRRIRVATHRLWSTVMVPQQCLSLCHVQLLLSTPNGREKLVYPPVAVKC